MSNDTIISFSDPTFHDELTERVRGGARRMLCEALIADVETFCAQYAGECPSSNKWDRCLVLLRECFAHHFHVTRRVVDSANDVSR